MNTAYIGIGSNLGNRVENCNDALRYITQFCEVTNTSSLYESEPAGYTQQPTFINAVLKIRTDKSPEMLLSSLKLIEKRMGRERTFRWGPRIIDLDILFYDNLVLETDRLIIPHEEMQKRRFVLEPMLEIESDLVHPKLNMSLQELVNRLERDDKIRKIGEFIT